MLNKLKQLLTFAKDICSELDGSGSASRVIGLLITLVTMGVLIAAVVFKHDLPSGDQLAGLAKIVACGSAAYAANKVSGMLTANSADAGASQGDGNVSQ